MRECYNHGCDCSHRKMSECDCSRGTCSSNSCCCGYEGHHDKYRMKLKKGAKLMLENAFYKALIEDQVERIKDILLDDDEMNETLEKTANLIVKVMKKQWQEVVSKSETSEEFDRELEKIFRRKKGRKEEDDVDIEDDEDDEDDKEETDEEK
jgi:hypothetical protein